MGFLNIYPLFFQGDLSFSYKIYTLHSYYSKFIKDRQEPDNFLNIFLIEPCYSQWPNTMLLSKHLCKHLINT